MSFENISLKKFEIYLIFFSNFCLFSFSSGYNGSMTSQSVYSSLHITINSSLSSILFDFVDIFIIRNIKSLSKSCFLLCNIPTFDVWFFNKRVQISHVSLITIAISDNNRKNWMKVEHVQRFYN